MAETKSACGELQTMANAGVECAFSIIFRSLPSTTLVFEFSSMQLVDDFLVVRMVARRAQAS
ncbi:MAG: hypothetical protein BM559_01535 [Roseobacter sp. MedPE-SWchi]|nr:MAG: hypothetical protein BM559_01535 [Roseobacter sp. MedPE-SWchi]